MSSTERSKPFPRWTATWSTCAISAWRARKRSLPRQVSLAMRSIPDCGALASNCATHLRSGPMSERDCVRRPSTEAEGLGLSFPDDFSLDEEDFASELREL